ncbi:hypothetical protein HDV03_000313 [Kappamyces sp. JEL0829]|nr:hypothetical protein HDV03_000313 [Kappamyces sp. JEL0829]
MLYTILALHPHNDTQLIYVTSTPLDRGIVSYFIGLAAASCLATKTVENVSLSAMTALLSNRILFYSMNDHSFVPLAEKLYNHPRMLARLSALCKQDEVLMVNTGGRYESQVARKLNIPVYSATKEQLYWGTKAGSREIFATCDIPHPDGTFEPLNTTASLVAMILQVVDRNRNVEQGIVKLLEGFAGRGNAVIQLAPIISLLSQGASSEELETQVLVQLRLMQFVCPTHTWASFEEAIGKMGAIFELWIPTPAEAVVTSPSVQVVIDEAFQVTVLSTHEQVLDGQQYTGCEFPALESYNVQLIEYGERVGKFLAAKGVRDHFSVDFVCISHPDGKTLLQAIEINLRVTGTTHPFMTMHLLLKGFFDPRTGSYHVPYDPHPRYYKCTDHFYHESLKKLLPIDILDLTKTCPELEWNHATGTGVVLHLLGCLSEFGSIGMTCVGTSHEESRAIFARACQRLLQEADQEPPCL